MKTRVISYTAGERGSVVNILENDLLNHWANINWSHNEHCINILVVFLKLRIV